MSEITFEQRIADEVSKQLNSGMVEKLIAEKLEKGISESLNDVFGYCGEGKKAIDEKVKEIIVPVIERHDFSKYIVKLDDCLTEIVNSTNLIDNKKILENFKDLMKEPETKEIKLSEIFEQYCNYVASSVDTSKLEAEECDGEPYYENVDVYMEVENEDKGWFLSSYDHCNVKFTCEQDENMNCQLRLYKNNYSEKWNILGKSDAIDINSLRNVSTFSILLSKINRAFMDIVIDTESECTDVEPEKKPEYSLI